MKYDLAKKYFTNGANCSQSVVLAFHKECGLTEDAAAKLSSSFGGGMGRMREVCGALTGAFIVAGILYGYSDLQDKTLKDAHYDRIQGFADQFKKQFGTVICRELLHLDKNENAGPVSTKRTPQFYAERPCSECVGFAAQMMENFIQAHPIDEPLF